MVDPTDLALHVGYEIDAMVRQALKIGTTDDAVIENALLEATLGHCRNLATFLGGKPWKDDIAPADFVDGWDAEAAGIPDDAVVAIHKHLSHLTKTRVTDGQQGWTHSLLVVTILEAMNRFVQACQADGKSATATTILRFHLDVSYQRVELAAWRRANPWATPTTSTTATTTVLLGSVGDVLNLGDFN